MYAFVQGTLRESNPNTAVVQAHGIGYKIAIPTQTYGQLPEIGADVLLHTAYVVREFSHALYGFLLKEERDLFEELIEISGVGPKTALALISHLSLQGLQEVVLSEDLNALCKVPGIGKKTGERLLVELKNRLDKFFIQLPPSLTAAKIPGEKGQRLQDAIKALVNLGYNPAAAQKALKKTLGDSDEVPELGTLITKTLQHL